MTADESYQVAENLDRHDAGPKVRCTEQLFDLLMDHRSHIDKLHSLEAYASVLQSFIQLLLTSGAQNSRARCDFGQNWEVRRGVLRLKARLILLNGLLLD